MSKLNETDQFSAWRDEICEGDILDVKDGDGIWFEAVVTDPDADGCEKEISIRYLGWGTEWNEDIKIDSHRLQPHNSQIPPWREHLKIGDSIEAELDASGNNDWQIGVVFEVKNKEIEVLFSDVRRVGEVREAIIITFDKFSARIAEIFTHTGKVNTQKSYPNKEICRRRSVILQRVRDMRKATMPKPAYKRHWTCLMERLYSEDFGENVLSWDLKIKYKEGETPFHVHKAILAASSNYFKSMLESGFKESKLAVETNVIFLDIEKEYLLQILKFIYTGECDMCQENIEGLLHYSSEYLMNELISNIEFFLTKQVGLENVVDFLKLALKFKLHFLEFDCEVFIRKNLVEIRPDLEKHQDDGGLLLKIIDCVLKEEKSK